MDEKEFEALMKRLGDEIRKEGGTYILNPASVQKASEIMKRLNAIKAADTDNENEIKISMDVSEYIGHFVTIMFSCNELFFDKKDFKDIKELFEFCDGFNIVPGQNERIIVSFSIDNYIIRLE